MWRRPRDKACGAPSGDLFAATGVIPHYREPENGPETTYSGQTARVVHGVPDEPFSGMTDEGNLKK